MIFGDIHRKSVKSTIEIGLIYWDFDEGSHAKVIYDLTIYDVRFGMGYVFLTTFSRYSLDNHILISY